MDYLDNGLDNDLDLRKKKKQEIDDKEDYYKKILRNTKQIKDSKFSRNLALGLSVPQGMRTAYKLSRLGFSNSDALQTGLAAGAINFIPSYAVGAGTNYLMSRNAKNKLRDLEEQKRLLYGEDERKEAMILEDMIEKVAEETTEQKENFFQKHKRRSAEYKRRKKDNPVYYRYFDEKIEKLKNHKNPIVNLMANNQKGAKIGANAGALAGFLAKYRNIFTSYDPKDMNKAIGLIAGLSAAGTLAGSKIEDVLKKRKKAQEEKQAFSLLEDMIEKVAYENDVDEPEVLAAMDKEAEEERQYEYDERARRFLDNVRKNKAGRVITDIALGKNNIREYGDARDSYNIARKNADALQEVAAQNRLKRAKARMSARGLSGGLGVGTLALSGINAKRSRDFEKMVNDTLERFGKD